jgi:hypothetical protein
VDWPWQRVRSRGFAFSRRLFDELAGLRAVWTCAVRASISSGRPSIFIREPAGRALSRVTTTPPSSSGDLNVIEDHQGAATLVCVLAWLLYMDGNCRRGWCCCRSAVPISCSAAAPAASRAAQEHSASLLSVLRKPLRARGPPFGMEQRETEDFVAVCRGSSSSGCVWCRRGPEHAVIELVAGPRWCLGFLYAFYMGLEGSKLSFGLGLFDVGTRRSAASTCRSGSPAAPSGSSTARSM